MSILIGVIYAAFISLGLPDAVVGAAWPAMAADLGADPAGAGVVSLIVVCSTTTVSFASGALLERFGTFGVSAASVALTAVALLGYSVAPDFLWLCLIAVPLGLGGGAIDAALNSYAAVHFSARSMNLLHASWGIGATAGPLIVGLTLSTSGSWRPAYVVLAAVQGAILLLLLASRRLWPRDGRAARRAAEREAATHGAGDGHRDDPGEVSDTVSPAEPPGPDGQASYHPSRSVPWYRIPGLPATLAGFLCYCSLELTTGLWGATFLALHHGFSGDVAAAGAAAFYVGLTGGRVLAAFITAWVSNGRLLVGGSLLLSAGAAIALTVGVPAGALLGFGLVGLGCAPIYPTTIKETTRRFGADNTPRLMGLQMGFAYFGQLLVPPLVGWAMTRISPMTMPVTVLVLAVGVLASSLYVERLVVRREAAAR